MKKQLIATATICGLSVGAYAQGSINIDAGLPSGVGITTQGTGADGVNTATTWYDGTVNLTIYYAASVASGDLAAINAQNNQIGGANVSLADLTADGFVIASAVITDKVNSGTIDFGNSVINLTGVPTSADGYLAIVVTAVGGTYDGYTGVLAFANNTGGNPTTVPPGTAATLTGWDALGSNLVLSPANAVPEPGTLALAALGGASLLLFRRKK